MSDSAAIHLHLYKASSLIDTYGNAEFPFFKFKTEEEERKFQGKPELWAEFFLDARSVDKLRTIWTQDRGAGSILYKTAELFGWNRNFCSVDYTLDMDGMGVKYNEYLDEVEDQIWTGFSELHLRE